MFTFSAAAKYFTIRAAYSVSVVSITRQPLVFAIRTVRAHLPQYSQSSITAPTRSTLTNIWYFFHNSYYLKLNVKMKLFT